MRRAAVWATGAAVTAALGLTALGPEPEPADDRANVVVIMTDDMRLDDLAYMPNVQRLLADRGVTFTQGLSPYPLCCPARAMLLTGQYAHNNHVEGNRWPRGGYGRLNHDNTLPVWLDRNGYHTAFVGKYLNEYAQFTGGDVPPGWDSWNGSTYGIYDYFNLTTSDDGDLTEHPGVYQTLVLDGYADDDLARYAGSRSPFFLWASYVTPHAQCSEALARLADEEGGSCWVPPSPAPVDEGTFAGLPPVSSPALNEADVSDKGPFLSDLPPLDQATLAELQRLRQARIESLQAVDRSVATLVGRLEQTGAWDDTYVIFTSDNGNSLGEHRWAQKQLPYEEMVRVPLIMTGPGIPAGVTREQAVTIADIAATATDVAGITGGREQDGESLLPLARGEIPDARDRMVLLEAGPLNGRSPGWLYQGVRTDRYTLVRWGDGFVELYDRDTDPYQLASVAQDPAYADVRGYLEGALSDLVDCRGTECTQDYAGPGPALRR